MTALPDVVRQSELLNQLVLNRSTMEELGRIEVLWMYPPSHRVLGFVCKAGFLGRRKLAFKLSQVEAMGTNGILTHSQPDETDAERVSQLESLVQCEVWSNAGHKLGKIIDCVFNLRTGAIVDYLVVGDRFSTLTGSIYRLPPHKVMSLGRERVLIAETALQDLAAYREGIHQKIAKVSTALKDEYEDVTEELRSLAKRAQETTQQTSGQIKSLADQARERAQLLADQARERAKELNEQWLENAQQLAEKARETSETWVERVQDVTEDWSEPLSDRPTVTVPATEVPEWEDNLDWEEDLFEDDEPQPTPRSTTPLTATSGSAPTPHGPPVPPTTPPTPFAEEDYWVIGDDLTLKRPTAIAQDQEPFTIAEDWNVEDDPWDITTPPTEETPVVSHFKQTIEDLETPQADLEITSDNTAPSPDSKPETVAESQPQAQVSMDPSTNDDEEPWI